MTGEERFWLFILAAGVFIMIVAGFSAVFGHMREVSKRQDT
jgi:hypothetical protein